MYHPITYITDCYDGNAQARLSTRIGALFGRSPIIVPTDPSDPEASAAITLLDCLRSTELLGETGHPAIILLNIAPRDGKWPNGVPFCYFKYGKHLIVSTFNSRALGLVRRHLDIKQVHVTDIPTALEAAKDNWANFTDADVERIKHTQFRSLWYLPLLAKWVADERAVPTTIEDIPADDDPVIVSVVDNFGNCKLNCQAEDIGFKLGSSLNILRYDSHGEAEPQQVPCYEHLTGVPKGQPGLIAGSSGFDFIELVIRGGSAADTFGLRAGVEALRRPAVIG